MDEDIESEKSEFPPIELPILIRVGWSMKALGWIGILFFGFMAALSWKSGQIGALYCFLGFIGMYIFILILTRSTILVDDAAIKVTVPYGTYRIAWDDVQVIKQNGDNIAFEGNNKRIVISTTFGSGRTGDLIRYTMFQSASRGIPIKQTIFPITHKNTRISF